MIRGHSTEGVSRAGGILTTVRPPQTKARQDGLFMTVVSPESFATVSLPTKGILLIGRGAEAEVRIDDPLASRVHCRLHVADGSVEVEDLESANGTLLRNQALQPGVRAPLVPGDALSIGATILMLRSGR